MKRQHGSVLVVVIFILGCAIAAGFYVWRPEPKIRPPTAPKLPAVSVITAQPETHQMRVKTQGTVVPSRAINLVAEVSGRVDSVSDQFGSGAFFKTGEVLVNLDSRDYQYRATEMQAQVAAAKRELAVEKGQARQARREWRDLGSSDANALFLRKPQLAAAQAQLNSAQAQYQQTQLNIERAVVRAPFNGRIESTEVNIGQYVTAGTMIARIYDSEFAELRLPLTNAQVAQLGLPLGVVLKDQQPSVTLFANVAGERREWLAKLVRTEASIDTTTRLYHAIVEIPQPFNTERYAFPLVMGLFVEALVEGLRVDKVVRLPEKSILKRQFVLTVNAHDELQQRAVSIIDKQGGYVWVRGDIAEGELIVVSDPTVVQVGAKVLAKIQRKTQKKLQKQVQALSQTQTN